MEEGETVAGNRVPRRHLRVVKVITHLHQESEKERKRRNDSELAFRGAWVAQSVKRPTSAQVTILRSVSSSPASGSGLMARSLEPVSDSVSPSPSLSAPPLLVLGLCFPQKQIHIKTKS